MHKLSSFSTRIVLTVLLTATVAFTAFVSLAMFRLENGLNRQTAQLSRLAEEKTSSALAAEARLAQVRINMLFTEVERYLLHTAQREDVRRAVASANHVAISEVLRRAVETSEIDRVIVVDAEFRVLGADSEQIDLLVTNEALARTSLPARGKAIIDSNDPISPSGLTLVNPIDEAYAKAVGAPGTSDLALITAVPIFDDFGDVIAVLIGHRALRAEEYVLDDFSKLGESGYVVLRGDRIISTAGIDVGKIRVPAGSSESQIVSVNDGRHLARCVPFLEQWHTCALAPSSVLDLLSERLVETTQNEGQSLAIWLFMVATLSLAVCGVVTAFIAREMTRPMAQITRAVRAVARGDWRAAVPGRDRADEIGKIARAVVVLQQSVKERDLLRSTAADVEVANQRRESLEEALKRFDKMMRSVLLSVTDGVDTMDQTARDLARLSKVAEGEADEAVFVLNNTVSSVSSIRAATEDLTESIANMSALLGDISQALAKGNDAVDAASASTGELVSAGKDLDGLVGLVGEILHRSSFLAMNATLKASGDDAIADDYRSVAEDVEALTKRIREANDRLTSQSEEIRGTTSCTSETIVRIESILTDIVAGASTIESVMEDHGEASAKITERISAALTGSANVSSSVERLKSTVTDAHKTSMTVVSKAVDMADETRRLDSTVKTFLREVSE